jgi:hypothetical protein
MYKVAVEVMPRGVGGKTSSGGSKVSEGSKPTPESVVWRYGVLCHTKRKFQVNKNGSIGEMSLGYYHTCRPPYLHQ